MWGYVAIIVSLALIGMLWGGIIGQWGMITKLVATTILLGVVYWGYSMETAVPSYLPTTSAMMGGRRYRRKY